MKKDDNELNIKPNNLRNYKKKGTIKENILNELYSTTFKKLDDKYKDRLSLLLYNGNNVNNYFSKRVNLDKVVYKYDNDRLYITLSDFNNKIKSYSVKNINDNKNNSSYQNYTENMSNYMTCDTNNINNSEYQLKKKKRKTLSKENYKKFKEEELEMEIRRLLLNEDKELPKHIEKYIFKKLGQQYNFMKEDKKTPMNNLKVYGSFKGKPFFKDDKIKFDSINYIKEKTDQLRTLKSKRFKNYLSPIFFLGKTKDKYIQKISYASHNKIKKENKAQSINNIKQENIRFLNILGKDVNDLQDINKENKDII